MAGRHSADVVFVIDASGSMRPCIDGIRDHIGSLLAAFQNDANSSWDVRMEFLAHRDPRSGFELISVDHDDALRELYAGGSFFTTDSHTFSSALDRVRPAGDESPLVALDCALDLPWRRRDATHRAVIMLADEKFKGGTRKSESRELLPRIVDKMMALKVKLFLVAPDSSEFEDLSAADGALWKEVSGGDGLASVDFGELLSAFGKSITVSIQGTGVDPVVPRALFGQDVW